MATLIKGLKCEDFECYLKRIKSLNSFMVISVNGAFI